MIRVDKALVELGLVRSRTQAQRLILDGYVSLHGQRVAAASQMVDLIKDREYLVITSAAEIRFVSRGGLKMETGVQFLFKHLEIASLADLLSGAFPAEAETAFQPAVVALDIGISTGGFTDCLLQNGIPQVWGVDVGHKQLDTKLTNDPRVTAFEGINARRLIAELDARAIATKRPVPKFALVVIDVSFISLTLILPQAWLALARGGYLIALVKPQFELGAAALDKRGVVKDPNLYQNLERTMKDWAKAQANPAENLNSEKAERSHAEILAWLDSPIQGGDGNREFLFILKKGTTT